MKTIDALFLILLTGCIINSPSASIPRYEEPKEGEVHATITNYRVFSYLSCRYGDNPLYRTDVLLVDGKRVSSGKEVRIAPGRHIVRLGCTACILWKGDWATGGGSRDFEVDLVENGKYRTNAIAFRSALSPCVPSIYEEVTGAEVGIPYVAPK